MSLSLSCLLLRLLNPKCFSSSESLLKKQINYRGKKKMCPHASRQAHTKIAIFQKKPTWLESRQDCGMKTCGSKSTADWISWLRRMKGICSFVTWFSIVTEWAFSSCPDCRPLRLSKAEAAVSIQGRLGHHDSSIFRGILNYSSHSTLTLRKWQSWEWESEDYLNVSIWCCL